MSIKSLCEKLSQLGIGYMENEPMSRHTSFKIGGPADVFVTLSDVSDITNTVSLCRCENVPLTVIGNGSNLLVSDDGIEGLVLRVFSSKGDISKNDGGIVTVSASLPLTFVCNYAQKNSLSGMEFAFGIPGTVGGALFMNAGAYGGRMKDVIVSADVLMPDGEIKTFNAEEMNLSYRNSIFKTNGGIILSVTLKLEEGNSDEIKEKMDYISNRRKSEQPLQYPSAGSVFKHPEGYYAGALIEQCGLKGKKIGGAQVSEKHSGFIINTDNATCKDVLDLVRFIKQTVFDNYSVVLETEIRPIGR